MHTQNPDLIDRQAKQADSERKKTLDNHLPDSLWVEAPAKINLTLDIKGKRSDGYHELETVMHQISLVDRISLERGGSEIKLDTNSTEIPDNEDNLAYRAARLLSEKYNLSEGLSIFIKKNIPVGAGLAGGSTDAAAVLFGMNQLFGLGLEKEQLLDLGAGLGSDVPFCLLGGTALARGRGEILTPVEAGPQLILVLVKPDFQLSTAEVYRAFRLDKVELFPNNVAFLAAWQNYDIINVARQMNNVLETVSIARHPEIAAIKEQLCELGALNALMSGSGPSVLGIFSEFAMARQAWAKMKQRYQETYLVSSYKRGDKHD